ncbi:hypothetical protein SAMN05414139_04458 [Burkholderia sp. D7]|nr:hypothetical protein SAMN05414139_04458 [Burkholderia sp. D7]
MIRTLRIGQILAARVGTRAYGTGRAAPRCLLIVFPAQMRPASPDEPCASHGYRTSFQGAQYPAPAKLLSVDFVIVGGNEPCARFT